MNIGVVGILVVFGLFIILLFVNPRLSCFGKKLTSPFYPLFRRKRLAEERDRERKERLKKLKTTDYGMRLEEMAPPRPGISEEAPKKAEDYGLKLD